MNPIWDGPLGLRGCIQAIRNRTSGMMAAGALLIGTDGFSVPLEVATAALRDAQEPSALLTAAIAVGESTPLPNGFPATAFRWPLAFEATGSDLAYVAQGAGYHVRVQSEGAAVALRSSQFPAEASTPESASRGSRHFRTSASRQWLQIRFENARPGVRGLPEDQLPGTVHRLTGANHSDWRTGIPVYSRVVYREVYPGIDTVFHGQERELEFDFVVAPGADPSPIRLRIEGTEAVELAGDGSLRLGTPGGTLIQRRPIAYQDGPEGRELVEVGYTLQDDGAVAFRLGSYDPTRPLVIDPVLSYATFLGGSGFDQSWDLAVGANGSVYVVGETESVEFPELALLSTNAFQTNFQGGVTNLSGDAFVAKLNPEGTAFEWFTYFGGNDLDGAFTIALADGEQPVIGGFTSSTNFPTTPGAFQSEVRGETNRFTGRKPLEAFVARLSADGSTLLASTLYGGDGEDQVIDVAVLGDGRMLIVGSTTSTNLPVPETAIQPEHGGDVDGFMAIFAADAASLSSATYFGGSARDSIEGVALDNAGIAHVAGITLSTNLPLQEPIQSTNAGFGDAFLAGFRIAANSLVYSTYLGGHADDFAYRVVTDAAGKPWFVGETRSTNFPVVASVQSTNAGASDGFIGRLSSFGTELEFSTYLGGPVVDALWDIHVDPQGNAHVVGETFSGVFTGVSTNAPQPTNGGLSDVIIARLSPNGAVEATFHGSGSDDAAYGVSSDGAGNVYLSGSTRSAGFPLSSTNVAQAVYGGGLSDAFVLKLTYEPQLTAAMAADGIEVSWPSPNPGFVLESAPAVDSEGAWTPVGQPAEQSGGRHRVLLPLEATNSIFRLRWSPVSR